LGIEFVMFALRTCELDGATDRIADIELTLEGTRPSGRVRILEIGHVTVRPRVERIDDHLAVHRPGNFHATILEVLWYWLHSPVSLPDRLGFGEELRHLAPIKRFLPQRTLAEQLEPARIELTVELCEKVQCFRCKDFDLLADDRPQNIEAPSTLNC